MNQTKDESVHERHRLYLTKAITSMLVLPFAIMLSYPLAIVFFVIVWFLVASGLNFLGLEAWIMEAGFFITYGVGCAIIGYFAFIWPLRYHEPKK